MKENDLSNYRQVEIKNTDGKILSSKEEIDIFIKKIQSAFDADKIKPYIKCFQYRIENGLVFINRECINFIESRIHNYGHTIHFVL